MSVLISVVEAVCFLGGSALALVAGIGLGRFPDLLARMHAATKPQILGLVLMVIGMALHLRDPRVLGALVLVVAFQAITAPVAAHMVGRAGFRTDKVRTDLLVVDELTIDRIAAEQRWAQPSESAQPSGSEPDVDPPAASTAPPA